MADPVTLPAGIAVGPLTPDQVDAVVEIESAAFTTPWQAETFHGLIGRDGIVLLTMTDGDDVIGYAVLWCIVDQGELANIAIAEERRGRGLGAHLLRQALDVARERGVEKLFLEVRESNADALALYARFGFEQVGVRRRYYERPVEDAHVMLVELDPPDHSAGSRTV